MSFVKNFLEKNGCDVQKCAQVQIIVIYFNFVSYILYIILLFFLRV